MLVMKSVMNQQYPNTKILSYIHFQLAVVKQIDNLFDILQFKQKNSISFTALNEVTDGWCTKNISKFLLRKSLRHE